MSKKVVILGHSGFIGSHLENLLAASGMHDVVGRSLPGMDLGNPDGAVQLAPHLTHDCTVVLMAAVKRQFGDTLEAYRLNMAIVENVCKLLESHPVARVIFLSSAAVYGEETENTWISEQTHINPTSYYGIAKYSAERLLTKVCVGNQRTSLVCLRPPLVYGPGDQGKTYGPAGFVAAAKDGAPITLWGDGTERREFIYIDDLCRLIEHLVSDDFEGELNVVSGQSYCFADVIAALRVWFPELEVKTRPRSKQKANNAFDASRIRSLLPPSFEFTSLEEGVSRLVRPR